MAKCVRHVISPAVFALLANRKGHDLTRLGSPAWRSAHLPMADQLCSSESSSSPISLRDMDHLVWASLDVFERSDDDRFRPQSRWAGSQASPSPSVLTVTGLPPRFSSS